MKRKKTTEKRLGRRMMALMLTVLLTAGTLPLYPVYVRAEEWSSAYSYYNHNGNAVVFCPTSKTDGNIYYGTSGSKATSNVRFRTLGWKITVQSLSGATLQTMYCKLGGSYLTRVDTEIKSGYEYHLYALSLYSLKRRMNDKAKLAVADGQCRIVLDACMTVDKNGKLQGSMNDSGPASGSVYTTYSGIAGAAGWSDSARQSLHSYFNKEVKGLFYDVDVRKSTGISAVSGGGHYMYGTHITVKARTEKGYSFYRWSGLHRSSQINYSFYVDAHGAMTAEAEPIEVQIIYHRNQNIGDGVTVSRRVKYGVSSNRLEEHGWSKNGKKPLGYALSQGAASPNYALNARVTDNWIVKYAPQVHLYAVWEEEYNPPTPPEPTPPEPTPPEPTPPEPTPPEPTPPEPTPLEPTLPEPVLPEPELPWQVDPNPSSPEIPGTNPSQQSDENPTPVPDVTPTPEDSTVPENPEEPPAEEVQKKPVRIRFISKQYFENSEGNLVAVRDGGLAEDSRWVCEDTLRSMLRQVLAACVRK